MSNGRNEPQGDHHSPTVPPSLAFRQAQGPYPPPPSSSLSLSQRTLRHPDVRSARPSMGLRDTPWPPLSGGHLICLSITSPSTPSRHRKLRTPHPHQPRSGHRNLGDRARWTAPARSSKDFQPRHCKDEGLGQSFGSSYPSFLKKPMRLRRGHHMSPSSFGIRPIERNEEKSPPSMQVRADAGEPVVSSKPQRIPLSIGHFRTVERHLTCQGANDRHISRLAYRAAAPAPVCGHAAGRAGISR